MTGIRRANLFDPAVSRPLSRARGAVTQIGPLAIGRAVLERGWTWSDDVKPTVGTEWCEVHHLHVLLAGRLGVRMRDGDEWEEFGPGDVLEIPPGHHARVVGDDPVELLDVSGNVGGFGSPTSTSRIVVTMLMSDIVDSTPTAARMGDGPWRQKLADHDRVMRSAIAQFRGREIETTGDGFFVAFDSAAGALQCARAMRGTVRDLGLQIRVGVHTGEIETTEAGVRGIAVHALARIMAAAGPSEILVSNVTRVLTEGSMAALTPRGPHALKGIEAPMELYELE